MDKYLATPDRELLTGQSKGSTKVQLGEPKAIIGVVYIYMGDGLPTEAKNDSKTATSLNPP